MKLKNAKLTFEDWKNRVETNNKDFTLLETYYQKISNGRNRTYLKLKHEICGTIFDKDSNKAMNKKNHYIINCPKCGNTMRVSYLHAIISSIAKKLYPLSKFEYDIGFRNGKSRYDLFIPNLNGKDTIIEFQSRYHDQNKEFDKEKRLFAENLGYTYLSFDHREITENEVCNILFGVNIEDIKDINLESFYSINLNLKSIQEDLNNYKSIKAITRDYNTNETVIRTLIKNKILIRPEDHVKVVRMEKSIVRLSMDGEFIKRYKNPYEYTKETGFKVAIKKDNITICHGDVFMTEEMYLDGNYTIPDIAQYYSKTFYMIDDNMQILKEYHSLIDAKNDVGCVNTSSISSVLKHKIKAIHNYKFIWKYEYDKQLNNV